MTPSEAMLAELGRVVVASAGLEQALLELLYECTSEDFTEAVQALGTPGFRQALGDAKRLIRDGPLSDGTKSTVLDRLQQVAAVMGQRNDLLHSVWVDEDVQRRGKSRETRYLQRVSLRMVRNIGVRLTNSTSAMQYCWQAVVNDLGRLDPAGESGLPSRWMDGEIRPAVDEPRETGLLETHVFVFGAGELTASVTSQVLEVSVPEDSQGDARINPPPLR